MWITRTSINQPVFATMVMLALVVLGLFSYRLLPVEEMPEISMPEAYITVDYPGASPEAIEDEVIKPVENVINSIDGVRNIYATAREGHAFFQIEFRLETDVIAATQDVATDGMAVAMLAPGERGFANGLQVAGYRIGMIIGGGVLLGLYVDIGHRGSFAIMAALTLLASVPVFTAREPEVPVAETTEPHVHFLHRPGAWRLIALVVVYKAGDAFAQGCLGARGRVPGDDVEAVGQGAGDPAAANDAAAESGEGLDLGDEGHRGLLVL